MKHLVFMLLLIVATLPAQAQVTVEGTPKSLSYQLKAKTPQQTMPAIDLAALQAEDELNDQLNVPYRFAKPFKVNYNLDNSGVWEALPDGGRIWRLKIACPDALSINFLYDNFYIPKGGEFYIYDENHEQIIGAMGAHNNRPSRKFATRLLWSDVAVLEYYEPAAARGKSAISIAQVAHGYRGFPGSESNGQLGWSGTCQVNVNCSEGDNWQLEKRAVAKIIIDGSGLCTGTLINNSAQDCTPYFLTADHCIDPTYDAVTNPNAPNFVFYWNFERSGCSNTGAVDDTQTTVGATLLANPASADVTVTSDFALFLLSTNPADFYNVYFAGFDASGASGTGGVGIHHPSGDAKKISTHSTVPPTVVNNNYWRIFWDQTPNGWSVTEGGSSGSALFDPSGNIIGQLFGSLSPGNPNCTDPANDNGDYGKMSVSWTNGGAINSRRLDAWLDPIGAGANTIVNGSLAPCSSNDLCVDAEEISCGSTVINTTSSASSTDTPNTFCGTSSFGTEPGVWYRFTGTGDIVTINTCGGASDYNTKLQVFSGSCGSLSCVAGSDDFCSLQSSVNFCSEAGTDYYVFVYGFGSATGNFELSVSCTPDIIAPSISCPADITVNTDPAQCGAIVNYANASASDFCGIDNISYSQNSGTFFPEGTTHVQATATDNSGNTNSCHFNVTVNDNEPPVAACLTTTVEIQPDGMYELQLSDVYDAANSSDNCGIDQATFTATTYTCDDVDLTFNVPVSVFDLSGNVSSCNASITVTIGDALPPEWSTADIGANAFGNAYSFDPCTDPDPTNGEFTITGSGNNGFNPTQDAIAFAHQNVCGDFTLTAKMESVDQNGYGGLMVRESTAPGSKQFSLFSNLTNTLLVQIRTATNGPKQQQLHSRPFPVWLRVQRMGPWLMGYYSQNGVNYQFVQAALLPSFSNCLEIGLSTFTSYGSPATAVFSNVDVAGGAALISDGQTPAFLQQQSAQTTLKAELFPNPTSNLFTLTFPQALKGEATATLRNQVGQVITQRQLKPGDVTTKWDVSELPGGLYFMEVRQAGQSAQVLRVIKAE